MLVFISTPQFHKCFCGFCKIFVTTGRKKIKVSLCEEKKRKIETRWREKQTGGGGGGKVKYVKQRSESRT